MTQNRTVPLADRLDATATKLGAGPVKTRHASAALIRQLVEAGDKVLNGLNARIDEAAQKGERVPVFEGIADLHAALQQAHQGSERDDG